MSREASIRATAYHEAGHAAVAFLVGFRIRDATIKPAGDYSGLVRYSPRGRLDLDSSTPHSRIKAEHWVMATLAGDIAQRRFAPRSVRAWHATADRTSAAHIAFAMSGSQESAQAFLDWLFIRSRDLVHGRWPLVESVAKALLDRETLSGDEVREAIFSSHTRPLAGMSVT